MCFGGNVGVYDTLGVKLATFHQTGRKDTKKNSRFLALNLKPLVL